MSFDKLFKENGFLSEEGKKVLQPLHDGLTEVMTSPEVRNMSVQELQVLQANLAKLIGDAVSGAIYVKTRNDLSISHYCDIYEISIV